MWYWMRAVQAVPTFVPTFIQRFWATLGRCCVVLDEGCSSGTNICSNIRSTFLGHVGTMLCGVERLFFKRCQDLSTFLHEFVARNVKDKLSFALMLF